MPIERKLAAIMFTDIAGYTAQMSKDQDVAFSLLDTKQRTLRPLVKKHNGTFVKEMGDGTLSHFPTAIDASNCSIEFQTAIKDNDNLNVRVGIHLGDTQFKNDDIFGDGVNIASRLESMSPTGGVLVSKNVYDELSSRKGYDGVSLGLQSLKGIGRLIEVYALKNKHLTVPVVEDYKKTMINIHSDDDVPSLAIITFQNKGADEDIFYAYGVSVDLISDISSAGLIRVASKRQIDEAGDLPLDKLAKKLDVRYIASGELWRMGDIFQLSIELYDSKEKKLIWSDRWQEKWDNLPMIKGSLYDELLKALETKPKVERRVDALNPEAYEFYLKAKHRYEKRENIDDTNASRRLLSKAIEIDGNLIAAKNLLGTTYAQMGGYEKAILIFTSTMKQAKKIKNHIWIGNNLRDLGNVYGMIGEYDKALQYYIDSREVYERIGNKYGIGAIFDNIGIIYTQKGEHDKALKFHTYSIEIKEEIGDKFGLALSLGNIGTLYHMKGDLDKALDWHEHAFEIKEVIGDSYGMGNVLGNIGMIYFDKGKYDKALHYYTDSERISKKLGNKRGMAINYTNFADVYIERGNYKKVIEYLEKCLIIEQELGLFVAFKLGVMTTLYLSYKYIGREYDEEEIYLLIKKTDPKKYEFHINFRLYQLLDDFSFLETAYKQVQEQVSVMDEDLGKKFLSYPIPKAIVEAWEKAK